jgi:hypothetical protein
VRACTHSEHAQWGLGHEKGPPLATEYAAAPVELPATYEATIATAILNQGSTPECEAYTGVEGRTITEAPFAGALWNFNPQDLFKLAGGTSDGTTTAAIEKALLKPGALATSGPLAGQRIPVQSCQSLATLAALKAALMAEQFAGLAMDWDEAWFDPEPNGTLPAPSGQIAGGHMFRICGWNATALHVANSWGTGWGVHGFCWLPFAYLDSTLEAYTQIAKPLEVPVGFAVKGLGTATPPSDPHIRLINVKTGAMVVPKLASYRALDGDTISLPAANGGANQPCYIVAQDGVMYALLARNCTFVPDA